MPMTREQLLQVQASARVYQTRADEAFEPWGMRAPAPVLGEDPDDYRRKLMILAKNQLPESHELRKSRSSAFPMMPSITLRRCTMTLAVMLEQETTVSLLVKCEWSRRSILRMGVSLSSSMERAVLSMI